MCYFAVEKLKVTEYTCFPQRHLCCFYIFPFYGKGHIYICIVEITNHIICNGGTAIRDD